MHTTRRIVLSAIAVALAFFACIPALLGEGPTTAPSGDGKTPLAVHQEQVARMLDEMEQKFMTLIQGLQAAEPERAKRLQEALEQARKAQMSDRAGRIIALLNAQNLDSASTGQRQLIDDLRKLVDLLTREGKDLDATRKEIERLEKTNREIQRLIKQETEQRVENAKTAQRDKTMNDLAARAAALRDLIGKQEQLRGQTGNLKDKAPQRLPDLAKPQGDLRKKTQKLAGDQSQESTPGSSPSTPSEGSKPGETPGSPSSPSSPSPGSPSSPAESATSPMAQAAQAQAEAEKSLAAGKGKAAQEAQTKAIEKLRAELDKVEKEQARIARLPEDHAQKLAKGQDQTADDTKKLADQMGGSSGSPSSGQPSDAQPGSPSEGQSEPQPGQQQVKDASQQMKGAAEDLKKPDQKKALPKQADAIKKLQDAKKAVEERLAQLRKELQEERLANLESRFREMLARQKPLTIATLGLDQKAHDHWDRSDRLTCSGLAREQGAIAQMADLALEIIKDDGSTVVFPQLVEQLRDDMTGVRDLLAQEHTDRLTQNMQRDIEQQLEALIEAVAKARKDKEEQPPPPGQGQAQNATGMENLVPPSAELKLLRAAQLRVNHRTIDLDAQQPKIGQPVDSSIMQQSQRIARLQEEVRSMAQKLAQTQEPTKP